MSFTLEYNLMTGDNAPSIKQEPNRLELIAPLLPNAVALFADVNSYVNQARNGKCQGAMFINEDAELFISLGCAPTSPWVCVNTLVKTTPSGTPLPQRVTGDGYRTIPQPWVPCNPFPFINKESDLLAASHWANQRMWGGLQGAIVIAKDTGRMYIKETSNPTSPWRGSGLTTNSITPTGSIGSQTPSAIIGDKPRVAKNALSVSSPFIYKTSNFDIRQTGSLYNKAGSGKQRGMSLIIQGKLYVATGGTPTSPWRTPEGNTIYTPV